MHNTYSFNIVKDIDLRVGLRKFYSSIVLDDKPSSLVVIKMPVRGWLSANGLNMLLVFISAIKSYRDDIKIYVELLEPDLVNSLLGGDTERQDNELSLVTKKIIFYESTGLVSLLQKSKIFVLPSPSVYEKVKEKLQAYKKDAYYLYSSKMLALSPLIENEEEQYALTTRIQTLNNILYKNLFNRLAIEDIEESSSQIMFELVKNIYQHSSHNNIKRHEASGFACAQINKHPLIDISECPIEIVYSTLELKKSQTRGKSWKWLSITINDFGIGLTKRIKRYLEEKYLRDGPFKVGRFNIDENLLSNDAELIIMASTTDFSTKTVRSYSDEVWDSCDGTKKYQLAARGFGLVFCMSFIAKTFLITHYSQLFLKDVL